MITPNDSYYGFTATGGNDYVSTGTNYTTNVAGTNTTYLAINPINTNVVVQNAGLREATTGKSVKMNLTFAINEEARTIPLQAVPSVADFPTTIDSSFTQLAVSNQTNKNAYLNGIYDASSSTTIQYPQATFANYVPDFRLDACANVVTDNQGVVSWKDPASGFTASVYALDMLPTASRSAAVAAYEAWRQHGFDGAR